MGVNNMFQNKMKISNSKPSSKPSANKVIIVKFEEVDFFTAFVVGVPGKISVVL